MLGDKDCLCEGKGVIYDYSNAGDPCPECRSGFPAHMSSKVRFKADKAASRYGRSCAVVLALVLTVVIVATTTIYHLA